MCDAKLQVQTETFLAPAGKLNAQQGMMKQQAEQIIEIASAMTNLEAMIVTFVNAQPQPQESRPSNLQEIGND